MKVKFVYRELKLENLDKKQIQLNLKLATFINECKIWKLLVPVSCIDYSLWSGYNSVYRRSYVLAIGGSVFIEAGAVEIFAFSLENHHGVNSEKNWVYGLIITDVSFLTISCVKQLILVATRLEKHFLDASKHDISALLSTSSADGNQLLFQHSLVVYLPTEYYMDLEI
ncbi:unnamed protein product [Rhizophagus irregularis]|uniref:Uncharacterized protein n=1 Tax=Rhizophagus irregularis TaxID=588596 RepID=A0A916E3B9_9GLOM|nr:unnamed protein product [Rhizophagus irregularis]